MSYKCEVKTCDGVCGAEVVVHRGESIICGICNVWICPEHRKEDIPDPISRQLHTVCTACAYRIKELSEMSAQWKNYRLLAAGIINITNGMDQTFTRGQLKAVIALYAPTQDSENLVAGEIPSDLFEEVMGNKL